MGRKPGRYANGAKISSAKAAMQTEKAKKIRRNADNLRNGLKAKGIKKPPGTEAGHSSKGTSVNGQKGGWEKVSKNRAVETKNRKKLKAKGK
jgi:hypothetical protein